MQPENNKSAQTPQVPPFPTAPAPKLTAKPALTSVSDTKPIQPATPAPAGKGLWKIFSIISLGALAIAIVAAVLTVFYMASTKDEEIVGLKNQVASLEAEVSELKGYDETNPDQKYVEFQELGVRVPVSDELAEKISVKEIFIAGAVGSYFVNYGTCQSALGIIYNGSLADAMGLAGAADAPRILVGDIYTAFVTPETPPCTNGEITDLAAFTADNQAWLAALGNIETYEAVNEIQK
jgi:hypothetical protein